jgi:VIT1/CCC1 family predicted Fe2+/Mn2+ transporter
VDLDVLLDAACDGVYKGVIWTVALFIVLLFFTLLFVGLFAIGAIARAVAWMFIL